MKKYIILLLALCSMSACDYEAVNTNPYGVSDGELGPLKYGARFMNMQQRVIPIGSPSLTTGPGNDLQNTDLISSGNYIGYFGNNNNWGFNNEANWNFTDSRMNYAYQNFYSQIFLPWNEIYEIAKDSDSPSEQAILEIANIVRNIAWLRATDVFGPIAYNSAGDGSIAPKFDSQEVVYRSMLADLSKSVELLNTISYSVMAQYDLIYNGNVQNWVKLANSLMLRIAVRVHFIDETLAKEYITKALDPKNGGVIEDISSEDVSTNAVMKEAVPGEVDLICKEDGIIAGLDVFSRVFELLDENTKTELYCKDGDEVKSGQLMGKVKGDIRVLLSGERVALNYLQRMSGIATYTHSVAKLLEGTKTKLLDTRKTTPNMRVFEKYAVTTGGGYNHRYNLSDGVLLKDNHIGAAGGVAQAVKMAKEYAPFVRKIEIEVETLDMVKEAVEAGADIIMLDNMTTEEMQEAIRIIDGRAETECSGNVTKENIARLTGLGVDYISSGALTHSSPILDISMKNLHPVKEDVR